LRDSIRTEVVIVGGGIAGTSAAYHIAKRGVSVVLLEKGLVGSNASGVNFGGVRTNGRSEGEMPLSMRAKALWHRMEEFVGHWCDYRMTGHVETTHDPQVMGEMERWAEMGRNYGQASELLTPRELRRRYPWLNRSLIGGLYVADDGSANPRLVVPTMALAGRKLGADIRENSPVTVFEREGGLFRVVTAGGLEVRAPKLINASGAWGDQVARHFGESFPVAPIAPQTVVSEPLREMKIGPTVEIRLNGRYLCVRQVENGNVLFCRGSGRVDLDAGRAHVLPESIFTGTHVANHFIPALRGLSIIRTWSGIDGLMPDEMPVMGLSEKVPGLVHGFGFSGHGFQLGPASGAVLCELALDGRTATQIEAFRVGRFVKAAPQAGAPGPAGQLGLAS
jgi:sarcosine oxidase subunit beta